MKILVTGGAGFIGSNFIRYWIKKYPDDSITNLDKLTYAGHLSTIKEFLANPRYKFVKGDILDRNKVNKLVKENNITHLVNFAAETHVDRSIVDPDSFVRTNVLGTQILLDVAKNLGLERFHHVSTDEVFGSLDLNTKKKFKHDTSYNPKSPYSASKAASDHFVRAYFHSYKLPITISNCSNNYGPFQHPEKFLPRAIINLLDDKPIKIYGDGKYVRDWLYVDDHNMGIDKIIRKGKIGESYLLGGMVKDVNNLEIAYMLIKLLKKNKDYIKFIKDRPGHDRRYSVDWSKTKRELGWKPQKDFETRLKDTIQWYKGNERWWRPLVNKSEKFYKNIEK